MSKVTEKEEAPEKTRELKPEVLRIAEVLKDQFKLDTTTGEFEQTGEDHLYEKTLPEDLTMKTVKQVHGHDRNFGAALTKVVGEVSLQAFIDNKELSRTSIKLPTDGRSSIAVKFDRKKEYTDRISVTSGDTPLVVTKFCKTSVFTTTSLGQDFNIIKRDLAERGKIALAD